MTPIMVHHIGTQRSRFGDFELYNLLEPLNEHPVYSTVSENTLRLAGRYPYVVEKNLSSTSQK